MIKLQVIGNLGRDCVQNQVNGKNVINFSVAHSEKYKDANGNIVEKTVWVECAYWTDRVAIAPYLIKGKTVYCEGIPEADSYMNKEGKAAAALRLRVLNIQLISGANTNNGTETTVPTSSNQSTTPIPASVNTAMSASSGDDDLPF